MSVPYFRGKQPVARDSLKGMAMKGDSRQRSHVGAGSNWQVLFNEELINFATSSALTGPLFVDNMASRVRNFLWRCGRGC